MRRKTVEIKGQRYELQSIPFKSYLDICDRNTDKNGNLRKSTYISELFKNCVINPKVGLEDFDDDYEAGIQLSVEIENFLTTKSKPNEDKKESGK